VTVLPGTFRAAWLVAWAPAREIADQTLKVASATTMVQTPAQTIMGSPRLIGTSCRGFGWRRVIPMARVLIIEDDPAIRSALQRVLTDRGDVVVAAGTGMAGMSILVREEPDIVLLDLGLPDVDGFGVLSMLRAVSEVPVIVITAQDDDRSTVRALDAGADDYVTKPFGADQVAARIRAVLRRSRRGPDEEEPALVIGELVIDPRSREVTLAGVPLGLSRKEFDVLLMLANRVGAVVTKRELLTEVWRQPYGGADRTVDVHLSWLRRKLGETAAQPRYLQSIRGVGVRLVNPLEGTP
jgi:DNA-binding response OmpR family regulator